MKNLIYVHRNFYRSYPFVPKILAKIFADQNNFEVIEEINEGVSLFDCLKDFKNIDKLVSLGLPIDERCMSLDVKIKEVYLESPDKHMLSLFENKLKDGGAFIYHKIGETHWSSSVSEFALALTLNGLRKIPQNYAEMKNSLEPWDFQLKKDENGNILRATQFSDDVHFVNGTLEGKRVRVVGAGNIACKFASIASLMGAEVKMWDPFASQPCFHRSYAKQAFHLEELVEDAEIFLPMIPLLDSTRGLIHKSLIDRIPTGSLVVMITRAAICNVDALYQRVFKKELALAADVFDAEPVPLGHQLLALDHVIHTPHIAGRTYDCQVAYAKEIFQQFKKEVGGKVPSNGFEPLTR